MMKTVNISVVLLLVLLASTNGFPPSPFHVAKRVAVTEKRTTGHSAEIVKMKNSDQGEYDRSPIYSGASGDSPVESDDKNVENNKGAERTDKSLADHAKNIIGASKKAVVSASKEVAGASKDVVVASKDAAIASKETVETAAVASKDVVVSASKEVANATKEVIEAGKDLITPDDACYGELGCFSMSAPWFSLLRPLPAPNKPEEIETQFYLYTRGQRDRFVVKQRSGVEFSVDGSDYDGRKETFFITHGFASNGNSSWLCDMKNAILKKYDGNVFLVDWGKGASKLNYFQVASNTRVVGATLANLGKHLITKEGADPSRFHIIGHSLGAQISSYAAKNITNVAKLTALDPAQPGFEGYDKTVRLDVSDANFVQVIHTSSRPFIPLIGLGMIQAYGHVDFYMNGGWNQPGCILPPKPNITSFLDLATVPVEVISNFISCPHGRSYEFLTATIAYDNCTFWGHRASVATKVATVLSGSLLSKHLISSPVNDCDDDTCSPLGFEAINYPGTGSYSIATSGKVPFCVAEPDVESRMRRFRGLRKRLGKSVDEKPQETK